MSESKSFSTFFSSPAYEQWKVQPVIVPEEIQREVDQRWARYDDPSLTREEFERMKAEDRARGEAGTEEAAYFKLALLRKAGKVAPRHVLEELEDSLRSCYCGSGKKYRDCHGASIK
jgi:hypothetical protein